tara:strand:+ start:285 stop:542 length:258 start_codon:yes stop_codon:yes gene_type:complete
MTKLFISIIICLSFYLFIKEDGLLEYYKGYNNYLTLEEEQFKLNQELKIIINENRLLKNNKRYIEKTAREEYFYIYPNEIIISLD